jgi:DNA-binding ferritin-like protein
MNANFLNKLKNALDDGNFNSDIATKLNEIVKVSEGKDYNEVSSKLEKIQAEQESFEDIGDETMGKSVKEHSDMIKKYAREDKINKEIALLIDMDDMVAATISDLVDHCNEVEKRFLEDTKQDEMIRVLRIKILEITEKYNNLK